MTAYYAETRVANEERSWSSSRKYFSTKIDKNYLLWHAAPVPWPSWSPDLSCQDNFLWRHKKSEESCWCDSWGFRWGYRCCYSYLLHTCVIYPACLELHNKCSAEVPEHASWLIEAILNNYCKRCIVKDAVNKYFLSFLLYIISCVCASPHHRYITIQQMIVIVSCTNS